MSIKAPVGIPKTDREFMKWCLETYDLRLKFGSGSPAGVVTANRGTLYLRTDGGAGTTLYVKEANDGLATGWVAK